MKIAVDTIDVHISNILNNNISKRVFPEEAKITYVRPISKKDREEMKNYRL